MRAILLAVLFLPALARAGFDEAIQTYAVGDYPKALAEFKPLAEQGDVKSEYYVGFLYHHGYGVDVDDAIAAKWFEKAAAQGDSDSMYYLGKMAEKGQGIPKDLIAAHMWLTLSANHAPNVRDAAYTREDVQKLEHKMSADQIKKANQLAKAWKPEK